MTAKAVLLFLVPALLACFPAAAATFIDFTEEPIKQLMIVNYFATIEIPLFLKFIT